LLHSNMFFQEIWSFCFFNITREQHVRACVRVGMQVCICTILWTSHTGVSLAISHFFSHFVVCVARTKSWPSWTKAVLWCEFPSVFIDSFDRNLKHTPIHMVDKLWNHGNLDTDGGTLQKHLKTSLVTHRVEVWSLLILHQWLWVHPRHLETFTETHAIYGILRSHMQFTPVLSCTCTCYILLHQKSMQSTV
jgi:hypothetical protein